MTAAHVGHDMRIGDECVNANNALRASHVTIGNRVFVGGTAVHQCIRLGNLCITRGNRALSREIPPYCVAAQLNRLFGLNVAGLRRAGYDAPTRADLPKASDHASRSGMNLTHALASAASLPWPAPSTLFLDFLGKITKKVFASRNDIPY